MDLFTILITNNGSFGGPGISSKNDTILKNQTDDGGSRLPIRWLLNPLLCKHVVSSTKIKTKSTLGNIYRRLRHLFFFKFEVKLVGVWDAERLIRREANPIGRKRWVVEFHRVYVGD